MYTNFKLNFFTLLLLGLVLTCTTSCDDDDDVTPQITISDLVGSWGATSFVFTENAEPAASFDFLENGGTLDFTLLSHGGVRTWITIDTFYDEWDAQLTISDNVITSDPVEASRGVKTLKVELEGDVLTLTNVNESFDFTHTGQPGVSATAVSRFERK